MILYGKKLTGINYIPLTQERTAYIDFNDLSEQEKEEVRDKITTRTMETLGYKKVIPKEKVAT